MKKISFFAILVILAVSATLAMAGGHFDMKDGMRHHPVKGGAGHHPGMGHGYEMNPFILAELGLSADQTEQIGVLGDSFEEDIAAIQTQISEKRTEMNDLWSQTDTDAQAIKAKAAEIHALMGQIQEKTTAHRLAVREVLTPEQLSELIATHSFRSLPGLDLTPEQTDAIQALHDSLENDITPLKIQVYEKQAELKALWNQTSPDTEYITALETEIHELRGQIQEKHTDFRLDVRETLTPEQLTELAEVGNRGHHLEGPYPGKGEGFHPAEGERPYYPENGEERPYSDMQGRRMGGTRW